MHIVGVCGSLQASSSNLTLLRSVPTVAPTGVEFSIFDGVRDLPLFDPDLERDGVVPPPVAQWRSVVADADALMVASPEYGHSLPGSLKNAIDWLIGSGELDGKVIGVTASVNHEMRGQKGLAAVLTTLAAVSANVVGGTAIARGPNEVEDLRTFVTAIAAAVSRGTVPE